LVPGLRSNPHSADTCPRVVSLIGKGEGHATWFAIKTCDQYDALLSAEHGAGTVIPVALHEWVRGRLREGREPRVAAVLEAVLLGAVAAGGGVSASR
jgi:hypothetical protein